MTAQSPAYALQNASHNAALFRLAAFSAWRDQSGIVGPTDLAVTAQSTPNMSVQVAAGRAWIKGTQLASVSGGTWSTQGGYYGYNDGPVSLTIAAADPTNPRIDLVVAQVQDAYYSGSNNTFALAVVTGTPAATPQAPAAPNNSLTLATVAVAANATSIGSGNIAAATGLLTVARGGIQPVTSSDTTAGAYLGQYRDHPTYGPQRWNPATSAWEAVAGKGMARAQMRQTTAQAGLAAGLQPITFGAADFDTFAGWSAGNSSRWTCPAGQGGTYLISGTVTFAAVTASAVLNAELWKNGAAIVSAGGGEAIGGQAGSNIDIVPKLVTLAPGDYVQLYGYVSATWGTAIYADAASMLTVVRID